MKIKEEKGITGIDVASGMVIFIIATALILTLYYQIYLNIVELRFKQVAITYCTQIFEQIDYYDYSYVDTSSKIDNTIAKNIVKAPYTYHISVEHYSDSNSEAKDIVEKITLTISYKINNNEERNFEMRKIKIKE